MKIAVFTEMNFTGKFPRSHENMRTEFAWMVALDAYHYNLVDTPEDHYDLGIVINSKMYPEKVSIKRIKEYCSRVAIMQEGPFWFFQDYELKNQIYYYNNIQAADIVLVHNKVDAQYFRGITINKDIKILPSLMVEDPIDIKTLQDTEKRSGVMIGGNMKSWYGGFDSFLLAKSITDEIYSPKMGQRQEREEELGITQLPYLQWNRWIVELSKRKIGVHMMRTHAAGTFALNCAYLGIPCIGYKGLDTQEICHPNLTVELGDIEHAKFLIEKLDKQKDFYYINSQAAKTNYKEKYHENIFNTTFKKQFKIS